MVLEHHSKYPLILVRKFPELVHIVLGSSGTLGVYKNMLLFLIISANHAYAKISVANISSLV